MIEKNGLRQDTYYSSEEEDKVELVVSVDVEGGQCSQWSKEWEHLIWVNANNLLGKRQVCHSWS